MSTAEEKKAIIFDRFAKREEERQALKEQRRAEYGFDETERDTIRNFYENMRMDSDAILAKLEESYLEPLTLLEQKNVFSEVMDGIELLSRRLTESTMFLPSFDVEQSRDLIQNLQTRLGVVREQLQPKKKFAFGRRKKVDLSQVNKNGTRQSNGQSNGQLNGQSNRQKLNGDTPTIQKPKAVQSLGDYGVSGRSDVADEIFLDATRGKDLYLSHLKNCRVRLSGGGKAMRIDQLDQCVVICGPMSGSIFIENCQDCVFVLACQQLRIHTTVRSAFYIHVTSKAIIEYCSELEFAPYLIESSDDVTVEDRFIDTNLNFGKNNWDKVDDFCHLAVDVPSSNWRIMDVEKRKCWTL